MKLFKPEYKGVLSRSQPGDADAI